MYAVISDGSRQYRVSQGHVIQVDYRAAEPGSTVEFGTVLLVSDGDDLKIGRPTVEGVKVVGEVVEQTSTKVRVQKYRRRKNYKRLRGHRQPYTRVRIQSIG